MMDRLEHLNIYYPKYNIDKYVFNNLFRLEYLKLYLTGKNNDIINNDIIPSSLKYLYISNHKYDGNNNIFPKTLQKIYLENMPIKKTFYTMICDIICDIIC
jgi:hypothetical protein